MRDIESQLREEILRALKGVTKANCPNIWERIQTEQGYMQVEEMIIDMVITDHITPSSCLSQLESQL